MIQTYIKAYAFSQISGSLCILCDCYYYLKNNETQEYRLFVCLQILHCSSAVVSNHVSLSVEDFLPLYYVLQLRFAHVRETALCSKCLCRCACTVSSLCLDVRHRSMFIWRQQKHLADRWLGISSPRHVSRSLEIRRRIPLVHLPIRCHPISQLCCALGSAHNFNIVSIQRFF